MTTRQLEVVVNDQLVGYLRENNDLWEFEYTSTWTASPQAYDLSPALPRFQRNRAADKDDLVASLFDPSPTVHSDGATNRPVQWYFDNLLPEEALRTLIANEADIAPEDAFGLLAHFGAESAGSLVLRDPLQTESVAHGLRPLELADLSRRIANLPRASLTKGSLKRMSLAGAQHKMLVVFKQGALFEPMAGTPSTHILKPNHLSGDYPASVMNEYVTMRLAKAVGLNVPAVHRLYVPQPVYIVERFDRQASPSRLDPWGDAVRLHAIDTCQLLNKARGFKYTAAKVDSLVAAVQHCRFKAKARMQLYQWLVFNFLVGNADNHLKNISFLVTAPGTEVAPAYDLLCTAVYETKTFANENARWPLTPLALAIGDAKTFAAVTRNHILDAGEALGLARATAQRELVRLLKALPVELEKLCTEIESGVERAVAASPDPAATRNYIGGERQMLRAVRFIIVPETTRQLA